MRSVLLLLSLIASLPALAAGSGTLARRAFDDIASLAGNWEGSYANGRKHTVNYRLSAGGSVIVETWTMSPTRESMTLYALDGDRLIATHYCPQGNQPRLVLERQDEQGRYRFRFLDGTNLQDAEGAHEHAFWLRIDSPATYRRSETYVENTRHDLEGVEEGEAVTYRRLDAVPPRKDR